MHKRILLGTVCLGSLLAANPAFAQSANVNDQIKALQNQIRAQQQQLEQQQQQLRTLMDAVQASQTQAKQAQDTAKAAETKIDTAAAQAAKAQVGTARATMSPTHSVGWESADGRNSIQFHGKIHYDAGIAGFHPDSAATRVQSLETGTNMRRLELGFSARIEEDWGATMAYEMGTGSGDSFNDVKKGFNTAKIQYFGFKPVTIESGYQDPPLDMDDSFGSENYIFLEHPAPEDAFNLFGGTGRGVPLLIKAGEGPWFVAGALTTYKTGTDHTTYGSSRAPWNAAFRATYNVWESGQDHLHVGGQYGRQLSPAGHVPGTGATLGLSSWAEYRIDGNKPITVTLGSLANPVDEVDKFGAEAALSWKSLFVGGEYFQINPHRKGIGDNTFDGYYVEAAYVLTGERRRYNPNSAGYGKPIPLHPASLSRGGWGAWEIAARYSHLDLNDRWHLGTTDPRAVNGGRMENITLGLNWYPTANNKFQLNYIHGGVYDLYSTARGNPSAGSKYNLFLLRSGFSF
jgi:phosphate-selective porin OprO and OprP